MRRKDCFSGNSSDLVIEQDLMRLFRVSGGMTSGRGITVLTMACLVNILTRCIPICDYLESVVGVSSLSSEQHKDLKPSRLACDTEDLNTFINCLKGHFSCAYSNSNESITGKAYTDIHQQREGKVIYSAAVEIL